MPLAAIEIGDTVSLRSGDGDGDWADYLITKTDGDQVYSGHCQISLSEREFWEANDMMKVAFTS